MRKILVLLAFLIASEMHADPKQTVLSVPFSTSCTTGGVRIIGPNRKRSYLICVNNGSATLYIANDSAPSATTGIPLSAAQSIVWEMQAPINAMYCTSSTSTQSLVCQEGN